MNPASILFGILLTTVLTGCASWYPPSEPEVSGSVDKESIRRVIREHLVQVRHCYEKELKVKPGLAGKLVLQWEIGAGGQVLSSQVNRSVDPQVDACMLETLKTWRFPPPPAGTPRVQVIYPFVFSATGDKT